MVRVFPCVSCSKPVRSDHKGIRCTKCHKWVHIDCIGISTDEYDDPLHEFLNWECPKCMFDYLPNYFVQGDISRSRGNSRGSRLSTGKSKYDCLRFEELNQKGLRIVHLNVRSLLRNLSEIELLLSQNNVHILSLNETWLDDSVLDQEVYIAGYQIIRKDRNRHGGGVVVYIKENLHYHLLRHNSLEHLEALPLLIAPEHSKAFVFMSWYRPPNSPICLFDYYEELVSFLDSFGRSVIIMGDLNCDIMKTPLSNETKHLNSINNIYSLNQINTTEYTRCSEHSISLIDHMLTNCCDMVASQGVIHSGISDHSICFLIWKHTVRDKTPRMITYRKMKNFDVNSFHNQLRSQPWHQVYDKCSLEEAVKVWEDLFMEVVNVHMPICQKRVKNKSSPWMCPEITKLISERDKLKSKARKVKVELFKATEESTKIELKKKQEDLWNRYSDDWLCATDNGQYTGAVLIDMKKAFDTVDISILLKKLMKVGVTGNSLAWFESYLSNREISTYFCSEMSDFSNVSYGVPQGSILGPLLFTLYIDDMVQQVEHCDIHLYADDTILYYSDNDVNCIDDFLNADLKRIHDWMCLNKLSLNVDKTESILIGTRSMLSKRKSLNVHISGNRIQSKETVKYLGVLIDQEFKWNAHIENLCTRTSKLVNFLGRLRVFINECNLKLIYRTIILPLFDYADVVFDSSSQKYTDQLQKLQNRAGRIILGIDPYKHISNHAIHQTLNWESLKSRRVKHTLSLAYKSINNLSAPYMQDLFEFISHQYSLRSDGNLVLPKPHSESCKRMFSYRGASYFNDLPRDVKSSHSYKSFLKAVNQNTLKWM